MVTIDENNLKRTEIASKKFTLLMRLSSLPDFNLVFRKGLVERKRTEKRPGTSDRQTLCVKLTLSIDHLNLSLISIYRP